MMATTTSFQKTMKSLKESNSIDSKISALTSLRRTYLEDQKSMRSVVDEDFCDLCKSIINASVSEDDKLYIEAWRTLDIILPETKQKKFDFFQSILQINRKKRLKILSSLSLLKDETVATIANQLSILEFLNDCIQSIQPKTMTWLLPENADNITLLKIAESKSLSENEDFEEKFVNKALQLLCRLTTLSSSGLNIRQFDEFIMDKVILLAYMGHRRQRVQAVLVLQQAANNDMGIRVRSIQKDNWDKYKSTLQNVYCKRMTLLVNMSDQNWAILWESSITLIGTDLHRGSGLVNSLLKVEELAFKSADPNRRQAFLSWKLLIDNFALDQRELATTRRIKLLCVPLNAKNSKTELMVLTKLEVWWHLIYKVYPSIAECIEAVLIPYLNACFGPFGDKPLFIQKTDSNVSLGKKFSKTQIFAIDTYMQLMINKEDLLDFSISNVTDKLLNPVSSSLFESFHKVFIHCFGEILLMLGFLPDEDVKNKKDVCKILWDSIIKRIEEYDKIKVSMYKEVMNVIVELIKNRFHKIALIRDFLLNIVLKNLDQISSHLHFPENTLVDLIQMFLQVENFPYFTTEHYIFIDSLLWQLIKPKNSNIYYPQTLELMQTILKVLDDARQIKNTNVSTVIEIWCMLAKIAKKYIEDSQNFNEGSTINHNFKTIEEIIDFPFTKLSLDDQSELKNVAETWKALYEQFDFQTGLIVTVKPNEILNKTSNMILKALKTDKKCCEFAAICIDQLLNTLNYDYLPDTNDQVPEFVQLLKDLTFQCLRMKSRATEKVLKSLSAFLLRVFSHNINSTITYLKVVEPTVTFMLDKIDYPSIDREIANTWNTIVGIFKKLDKSVFLGLLNNYQKSMVLSMLHQNKDISSQSYIILDLIENSDDQTKKITGKIMNEVSGASFKKNFDEMKEKSKKVKMPIKSIGSFLNRKTLSPSHTTSNMQNGKENIEKSKVLNNEPDSQDFVVINTDRKLDVNYLTEHQKEMLKKRRDDIPAMYNELSISNSQDTQELQRCFDVKTGNIANTEKSEPPIYNNEPRTPNSFKDITKTLSKGSLRESSDNNAASPKARPKQMEENDADASTVEDSQAKEQTPVVAKKLDFESRDDFPADREEISPSMLDNTKMKRRNPEDNNVSNAAQNKIGRMTRRSLQPQGTLRKSNSTEQLNKRGRKRRNSENNSEGMLDIEREKRPRQDTSSEGLSSSGIESNSNEENKNADTDTKKISKRQLNEMSRLKIDMRFEPLPNRRSVGKHAETAIGDKKTIATKDEKAKEDKSPSKSETNIHLQHPKDYPKRRSMKGCISTGSIKNDSVEKEIHKKDSLNKKSENVEINKIIKRKSVPGKGETGAENKKKSSIVEETQEEIIIEDVSTPMDCISIDDDSDIGFPKAAKVSQSENTESDIIDDKYSQDSDIVESSQEPTTTSKLDKVECFIKIKKMELLQQPPKSSENITSEKTEKAEKTEETQLEDDKKIAHTVPAVLEPEKATPEPSEAKKIETVQGKPLANLTSSPKSTNSRLFRSKAFPLQGRAAQMLGLVTKQSIAEKLAADCSLNDDVVVTSVSKLDKTPKENDRMSSPSSGSRQHKMFSNMNNNMRKEREDICQSPSISMFCNLKNDGERISPKLDRHERDNEISLTNDQEFPQNSQDDSPNGKSRKELPLLEWSNANPPSLTASPSVSILKRMQEIDMETPNSRKKRVSFADPPVSREMGYEIMTDSNSSPKMEKLPSSRSPSMRKEPKKHVRLRLIQIDQERFEKENDVIPLNNGEEKPLEPVNVVETVNSVESLIPVIPKVKLSTVISLNESKLDETENNAIKNTQDVDMFADGNSPSTNDESIEVAKTSTQNDNNNSSLKLDSINLSNILHKSDHQNSLEDTVDVDNISSSLEGAENASNKPTRTVSQQSTDVGDTLPVTDSIFSNLPLSQETQPNVAQLIEPENLDSTLPVYPSLISCGDAIEEISAELVDPLFTNHLTKLLSTKSIRSVGDLAQLTERDINRLPIKSPKISCVKNALSRYEEKVAKTPDRKTVSVVSSSTPIGNKRKDKHTVMNDTFDDLVKSNSNSSDLAAINVSAVLECRRSTKRYSTDSSVQTSPAKKPKKSNQEVCDELMDQCDDAVLFDAFIKKFDAKRILKGYKEKMIYKTEKDLKVETLNLLGLSVEDDSEASFNASTKTVGLQKVLEQLPKIFDADQKFIDTVLKTYKNKLNADKVLDVFKPSDVKDACINKFTSTELLNILAEKLAQEKEKGVSESIPDTNDLQVLLDKVSVDAISNLIKRRMN